MNDDCDAKHDNHQENPDLNLNPTIVRINVAPTAVRITAFGFHYSHLLNIDVSQVTTELRQLRSSLVTIG